MAYCLTDLASAAVPRPITFKSGARHQAPGTGHRELLENLEGENLVRTPSRDLGQCQRSDNATPRPPLTALLAELLPSHQEQRYPQKNTPISQNEDKN